MEQNIYLILASFLLLSTIQVFLCDNAVYSVLFLILNFCLSALILLTFKVEFLGLLFIMVYVGAVAVLFLFVIMMIDTKKKIITNKQSFFPFFLLISILLFIILFNFFESSHFFKQKYLSDQDIYLKTIGGIKFCLLVSRYQLDKIFNLYTVGQALYNNYNIGFILAGYILLIALVGAVFLTIDLKEESKKEKSQIPKSNFFNFF